MTIGLSIQNVASVVDKNVNRIGSDCLTAKIVVQLDTINMQEIGEICEVTWFSRNLEAFHELARTFRDLADEMEHDLEDLREVHDVDQEDLEATAQWVDEGGIDRVFSEVDEKLDLDTDARPDTRNDDEV